VTTETSRDFSQEKRDKLAKQGKAKMHSQMYDLAAGPDAFADLMAGRIRGRGILVPR